MTNKVAIWKNKFWKNYDFYKMAVKLIIGIVIIIICLFWHLAEKDIEPITVILGSGLILILDFFYYMLDKKHKNYDNDNLHVE